MNTGFQIIDGELHFDAEALETDYVPGQTYVFDITNAVLGPSKSSGIPMFTLTLEARDKPSLPKITDWLSFSDKVLNWKTIPSLLTILGTDELPSPIDPDWLKVTVSATVKLEDSAEYGPQARIDKYIERLS